MANPSTNDQGPDGSTSSWVMYVLMMPVSILALVGVIYYLAATMHDAPAEGAAPAGEHP
ncbi:MAG: hypothetical protein IT378_26020 [Sandaracinaceae bacterium]|nr:hypothetical protein [Sandaracinaceae bacterium]